MLIGTDLFDPERDATMKLTQGKIRQSKNQSVLDYATQFRSAVLAASPSLPASVICDKFVLGLHHPALRRDCVYPLHGGNWDDLHACISFAMAAEKRLLATASASGSANVVQTVVQSVPASAGMAGSEKAEECANAIRFKSPPFWGKKRLHKHNSSPRPQGPPRCHLCHQLGHMQRNCPQRKRKHDEDDGTERPQLRKHDFKRNKAFHGGGRGGSRAQPYV